MLAAGLVQEMVDLDTLLMSNVIGDKKKTIRFKNNASRQAFNWKLSLTV